MDILAWYLVLTFSLGLLLKSFATWLAEGRLQIADIVLGLCLFAVCVFRAHQAMAGCSP